MKFIVLIRVEEKRKEKKQEWYDSSSYLLCVTQQYIIPQHTLCVCVCLCFQIFCNEYASKWPNERRGAQKAQHCYWNRWYLSCVRSFVLFLVVVWWWWWWCFCVYFLLLFLFILYFIETPLNQFWIAIIHLYFKRW